MRQTVCGNGGESMGILKGIKRFLTVRCEREYAQRLAACQQSYAEWLNGRKAPEMGEAIREHAFTVLTFAEGEIAQGALQHLDRWFAEHPEQLLAYGDEDICAEMPGEYRDPMFRSEWSPDTFLNRRTLGSLVAVRTKWYEGLPEEDRCLTALTEKAGGFRRGACRIGHIPEILFHRVEKSTEEVSGDTVCALHAAENRVRDLEDCKVIPGLSVVIPSKDHSQILQNCLNALYRAAEGLSCEVIVVDNGSSPENKEQVEQMLKQAPIAAQYLYQPMEFHFSRMCNLGAQQAKGELLLFLNDDVELREAGCLKRMAVKAVRPFTGAVGLKLYYPKSRKIQHAGIVNLPMGPVHKLQFLEDDRAYYDEFNVGDRNVLAVTGACLMVTKDKYNEAGGMSEELPVAFNDVDLCFTLWEQGYYNVVLNSVSAWHHESLSRGEDESAQKLKRLEGERRKLYARHPELADGSDPYYSKHLNRDALDTRICPGYLTGKKQPQKSGWYSEKLDTTQYRRDRCLLFRPERCEQNCLQGYGVVLGDNNACYDRYLILWKAEGETAAEALSEPEGTIPCYKIRIEGQFRPDLTENMPDQTNVGLGGFWITAMPQGAEPGNYRLGIAAVSRVGSTRLINWSNRILEIGASKGDGNEL